MVIVQDDSGVKDVIDFPSRTVLLRGSQRPSLYNAISKLGIEYRPSDVGAVQPRPSAQTRGPSQSISGAHVTSRYRCRIPCPDRALNGFQRDP